MNKMTDVAMTLSVVALFADGPTAIRDVASWRVKETERMVAILTEPLKCQMLSVSSSQGCSHQGLKKPMEPLNKVKLVQETRECYHPTDPVHFLCLNMRCRERMYFLRDLINQNANIT